MRLLEPSPRAAADLVAVRPGDEADPLEVYARVVWSVLVEPGDGVAGALVRAHGAREALRIAVADDRPELAPARARWMPRLQPASVEAALASARRAQARFVLPGDPAWPERLDDLDEHSPLALWRRGDAETNAAPTIALVGARAATAYGEGVAADLAGDLAGSGAVVVSGAAYGIDGACHRAALAAGGATVAVLAGGVDRPYPRGHEALLGQIATRGAVWSETPCGSAPTKWRFLARNRLIAALADAVVVVEAGWRSGSLNTAAHAAHLGRPLGAVPGPVTSAASAGCHRVLREYGGVCVTSASDVWDMVGRPRDETSVDDRAPHETTRLFDALSARSPRSTIEIARRSGLAPDEAGVLLGFAELEGRVTRDDAGRWRATGGPGKG